MDEQSGNPKTGHPLFRRHRGSFRRRPVYGAIDLGTNNCRLLIALPRRGGIKVIDSFSRIVRLGEGLAETGRLGEAAVARTIEALAICRSKLEKRGAGRIRCIATAACREATNRADFIAYVKRETGLEVEIISAREEAGLAVCSCEALLKPTPRNALVFDIGGGSTEVIWAERQASGEATIKGWVSVPRGVITLAERFNAGEVDEALYAAMIEDVSGDLRAFEAEHGLARLIAEQGVQVVGTSGTVTTLAGLHLGLARYDRGRIDGLYMTTADFQAACQRVLRTPVAERGQLPCVGPERADMMIAGCAILESLCRMWPFAGLTVADRGLREGLLLGMMVADSGRRQSRKRWR